MIPNTDNPPTRVALMPDFREGVRLTETFASTVQVGRFGIEQRARRRLRPIYELDYVRTGLTAAEANQRVEGVRAEFRGPLTVPVWTDGIPLTDPMTVVGTASLDSNPISDEWVVPFDVYLWHDSLGGQWRTCTAINGRTLTFSGTGSLYPAGSFVFPSRLMIREAAEGSVSSVDFQSGSENHRYRTL